MKFLPMRYAQTHVVLPVMARVMMAGMVTSHIVIWVPTVMTVDHVFPSNAFQ